MPKIKITEDGVAFFENYPLSKDKKIAKTMTTEEFVKSNEFILQEVSLHEHVGYWVKQWAENLNQSTRRQVLRK